MTSLTALIFCCLLGSLHAEQAEEKVAKAPTLAESAKSIQRDWLHRQGNKTSIPNKSLMRTLGQDPGDSFDQPAVHVNSSAGMMGSSGSKSGIASRLRSARDAVIVPGEARSPQVKETVPGSTLDTVFAPGEAAKLGISKVVPNTSRRQKDVSVAPSDDAIAPEENDPEPLETVNMVLPSVMKRKSTAEEDVASGVPTIAAEVPTLATPLGAPKQQPKLEPTIAEPTPAKPITTPAPTAAINGENRPSGPAMLAPANGGDRGETVTEPIAEFASRTPIAPQAKRKETAETASSGFRPADENPEQDQDQPAPMTLQAEPPATQTVTRPTNPARKRVESDPTKKRSPVEMRIAPDTSESAESNSDDELISNRSPVLVVKTHGSKTIRVGTPATYYITAGNVGDLAAEEIIIDVNIPNWAEITQNQATSGLVRIQPSKEGHNVVKWSLSRLTPKSRQRLRLDVVPRSSQPIELGVTWNFKSVSAMAHIQVQEPKLQMSVLGPQDIQFGETKLYTVTVSNPGTGDAENVVLTLLPINDAGGAAGTRDLGTIAAGTRRTIEVELTARQAGELKVRALAVADGNLKAQGEQPVLVRRAQLAIEAVGPPKKYAGTTARYSVKITNTGDATARDVVAEATLPMAAKYVNSTAGGTYEAQGSKVNWAIGHLRPGAFQVVEVSTALMGAGANRLDVRTGSAEQLSAMGSVTTEVESLADLKLMVNDPRGAVAVGSEMIYEVRIINRGTKAAHHIDIVGYFSEGIEPVEVRGWRANLEVGQVIFEQIPRIAPGQEMVVRVAAQADRPGDHVFRAELDSTDPETKLAVEEWTRFYGEEATPHLGGDRREQQANAPRSLPPATLKR